MQNEQICSRAWRDRVGATLIVAELDEQSLVVKLLNDRPDLTTRELFRGAVCQQCHHIRKGWALIL
jgi:hypothetical protein